MSRFTLTVLAFAAGLVSVASADKVTFQNLTSGPLLVRCVSGGNQVSPLQEYRQTIAAGESHSRPDFASGNRAAVAWNADRSHCAAIPFEVRDGMTLMIKERPDGGEIFFEAPCSGCSSGGSVSTEPKGGASSRVAGARHRLTDELSIVCFISP